MRYPIYESAHKALRNLFSQVLFKAGNTDYSDAAASQLLFTQSEELFRLLASHVHSENTYMLPLLAEKVRETAEHDEHDHVRLEVLQQKAENMLTMIKAGTTDPRFTHAYYRALGDLYAEHLLHMLHEEEVTQEAFWQHFTDGELHDMTGNIVKSLKPEDSMIWFKYMIPALTQTERIEMLGGIKQAAPPQVMDAIFTTVGPYLVDKDYNSLRLAVA